MKKLTTFLRDLFIIGLRQPADIGHVLGIARHAAGQIVDAAADTRTIPVVDMQELPGAPGRTVVQTFPGVGASVSLAEAAALAALCRSVRAKRIFEFGTYKGVSTTQFALNLPEDGQIITLDLPEDHPCYSLAITKEEERMIAAEGGKGVLVPADLRHKVTFLKSDSASFEVAPYAGSMDLVFVDGAHSYEYVKNDSKKGWEMLRPGGILVWHDCVPSHPEVVKFVKECGWMPQRVQGTALAYALRN
ncbi:MAG: class I SAM-dependent methyltransferase [Candidatus Methylacidiphilales bacterium]|nr:class I SAM-dependent methyltransferase [Candidatus Methylacidiphilales bacterium]